MLDWTTTALPCHHRPIPAGTVLSLAPDGDVEWQSVKALSVPGTHDANLRVKSAGGDGAGWATELYLDGNPSKFLQGHNLFGSKDLISLVADSFDVIASRLQLEVPYDDRVAIEEGRYNVARVDVNESFELPSRADVRSWLRAAEFKSRTRQGRPTMKGGTLYHGQNSRRHSFKFYGKGDEIEARGHQLPPALQIPELIGWADNKLRAEACIRSLELKDLGLREAKALTPSVLSGLFYKYLRGIEMNEQFSLSSDQLFNLPNKVRASYVLWNSGEDLRSLLSHQTFYRHRKELLAFGIDISIRKESLDRSNVVPLIRVLEAVPAGIPDFAFTQGLVHHSARRVA